MHIANDSHFARGPGGRAEVTPRTLTATRATVTDTVYAPTAHTPRGETGIAKCSVLAQC